MYDTGYSSIFSDLIGCENLAQFIYNIWKQIIYQKKTEGKEYYYRILPFFKNNKL